MIGHCVAAWPRYCDAPTLSPRWRDGGEITLVTVTCHVSRGPGQWRDTAGRTAGGPHIVLCWAEGITDHSAAWRGNVMTMYFMGSPPHLADWFLYEVSIYYLTTTRFCVLRRIMTLAFMSRRSKYLGAIIYFVSIDTNGFIINCDCGWLLNLDDHETKWFDYHNYSKKIPWPADGKSYHFHHGFSPSWIFLMSPFPKEDLGSSSCMHM